MLPIGMHYIGVDIIEVDRVEKAVARWGELFLKRMYTDAELALCHSRPSSLATRFAAKEAVIKALGGRSQGFRWREIEILADSRGKPVVHLHGSVRRHADDMGVGDIAVSLSDSERYAVAFVVGGAEK